MKSHLKNLFIALSILLIPVAGHAQTGEPFTVVPVSGLTLTQTTESPENLSLDFSVPYGGSCHAYAAITISNPENPIIALILTDTLIPGCEGPEVQNFNVKFSIQIYADLQFVQLVNPVYIMKPDARHHED